MLAKGDLKFRLNGKNFTATSPSSACAPAARKQGNEWLLIKKRDGQAEEGYDAEEYDNSASPTAPCAKLPPHTTRMGQPPCRSQSRLKAAWLADAVAKLDEKNKPKRNESASDKKKLGKKQKERSLPLPSKPQNQTPTLPLPHRKPRPSQRPLPCRRDPSDARHARHQALQRPRLLFEIKWMVIAP